MVRRLTFLAIASLTLGIGLLVGPAFAGERQENEVFDSPPQISIPTTTTTIATTTTAILPTTITQEETTTTEAAAATTTTTVKGIVVNRPLPRTGGDFGVQVIVGAGLTAAGLAFAVTARLRRQQQAHANS